MKFYKNVLSDFVLFSLNLLFDNCIINMMQFWCRKNQKKSTKIRKMTENFREKKIYTQVFDKLHHKKLC